MPDLRTIPGVELVKVGRWEVSTGVFRVTKADLRSAVEAHQAGVLRKPVIKIGHDGDERDTDPALGYVDNLRLTDDGNTLVGDFVNIPAKLAALIPLAYPSRSIEGKVDYYQQSADRTWPLIIDAVALLGATAPGISELKSLEAVGDLYGVAAAHSQAVAVAAAARRRRANRLITTKG
ncbi:hypothetical protein GAN17_09465 [Mycobacterium kubicae]|uniref:hypothetical protein n=1 Tax=Mycobacterium kubicae TaxID=120959 RepID=UPI00163FF461|nr:hypothetical protein [Mycobacterium kubicae]QNI06500.1 hypothetical protein GAN17_09465 [Mycobacterium kubicae]